MNSIASRKRQVLNIMFLLSAFYGIGQTPPSWQDYIEAKQNNTQPILPDFSFSGYHFSEKDIPDVNSWLKFNVVDYGAVANDNDYDDNAIQAAIDAAEASEAPAVVFFPPGKFMVSSDNDLNKFIQVNKSYIVLKGSGSGVSGTEIFMDKKRVGNGHWQFIFQPETYNTSKLTEMTEPASRNDYSITVANTSNLSVGQNVIIRHKSQEFAVAHFGDLEIPFDKWYRLKNEYIEDGETKNGGMSLYENHVISQIEGNIITFKNPIQTDLPIIAGKTYTINNLKTIEEVGVEDILFTGNWPSVGEVFDHHKNDTHDYGWNAMRFKFVSNSWVRNCEFKDWSQVMDIRESIGITVTNTIVSGKGAHASFLTRRSYGLLFKDCEDITGSSIYDADTPATHHGPGVGYQGTSTVYLRYKMRQSQSVDAHSGQPYATLIDDTQGGDMHSNGGPEQSYPNHGRHFVFWNFKHNRHKDITYRFWDTERRRTVTYAEPYFIGLQSNLGVQFMGRLPGETDESSGVGPGLNEMPGQEVSPKSLFEAQLALRLDGNLSVVNKNLDSKIHVFPNPFFGNMKLKLPENESIKALKLIAMDGSQIPIDYNRQKATIYLQPQIELSSGIYILNIQLSEKMVHLKVVKQ